MWLSKQNTDTNQEMTASIGNVTISGDDIGVYTDMEHRGVTTFSPGGYFWRPRVGQNMLVIKCDEGNCISGTEMKNIPASMAVGEVYIKSESGASIWLKNNGDIAISGNVNIEGSLSVNGNSIA